MTDLRRSLVINFLSNSGSTLLQFVVSILLARILSPSEIGLYSMTLVFVNLAHVFRDFGVSAYLQREKDLTPDKIRSANGVVFTTSWVIAASLYVSTGWLGRWLHEPGIVPIMHVLAIGFIFVPFGTVTNGLLAREYAADKQAWVNVCGTLTYCSSTLLLGKLGLGAMALAYGNLINILACSVAYVFIRPKHSPWLPGFKHWRDVAQFGLSALVATSLNALNNAIPDTLLGKLGSARQVGLLSRANSTVTIFTYVAGGTVSYGAVTYLSKAYHRGESLVPTLVRNTRLLTGVGWTALTLTIVLGQDIVLALYGPGWGESVPAIVPLACAALINMMFYYVSTALLAIGRPYLSAFSVLVTVVARIAFGVILFDGSLARFGWTLCLATAAAAPVSAFIQYRFFGLAFSLLLRSLLPSAAIALGTAAAAAVLAQLVPATLPSLVRLLAMAPPLAVVWYLLLKATRHELLDELHRLAGPIKARLALLRPNV
jgi:O-antigen/teichoic acid export membrane protein